MTPRRITADGRHDLQARQLAAGGEGVAYVALQRAVKTIDASSTAETLAAFAPQNFAVAPGWLSTYSGWRTNQVNMSDTFRARSEFGFRTVSDLNGSLNTDVWPPISRAADLARRRSRAPPISRAADRVETMHDLDLPNPTTNIRLARAATFRDNNPNVPRCSSCHGRSPHRI